MSAATASRLFCRIADRADRAVEVAHNAAAFAAWRERHLLTLATIAEATGISAATWSRIANAKRAMTPFAQKALARAFPDLREDLENALG